MDGPVRLWADERERVAVCPAAGCGDPCAVARDEHELDVRPVVWVRGVVVARIVLRDCEGVVEELDGEEGGDVLKAKPEEARANYHPPEELSYESQWVVD